MEPYKDPSFQLMPGALDIREVTFTNLLLLDFEPEANEAKHRIPFNRDMFAFPNKKGMEVVLQFLCYKLNPEATSDEFRNCWPIYDKKQEHVFRKVVTGWLSRLSKDDPECHIPKAFASTLLNPGGDKFYRLLFHFSSYVLKVKLKEIGGKKLRLPPYPMKSGATKTVFARLQKIFTNRTIIDIQRVIEYSKSAAIVQESWLQFASTQIKEHRSLRKCHRDWEKKLIDLDAKCEQLGYSRPSLSSQSPYTRDTRAVKRTKLLQKVRQQVKDIKLLYEQLGQSLSTVQQTLQDPGDRQSITASQLDIRVPERLLRQFEDEIHQRRIQNIYLGEKLNLISLVQLWNLSLLMIRNKLSEVALPYFEEDESQMRSCLHQQIAALESTNSLQKSLTEEMLPEITESIHDLRDAVEFRDQISEKAAFQLKQLAFDLASTSPKECRSHTFTESKGGQASRRSIFASSDCATPDAVTHLLRSVRKSKALEQVPGDLGHAPAFTSKRQGKTLIPTLIKGHAKVTAQTEKEFVREPKEVNDNTLDAVSEIKKTHKGSLRSAAKLSEHQIKDLLAEKIANEVVSQSEVCTKKCSYDSDSSENDKESLKEQAVSSPVTALGKEAFQAKRNLLRTPMNRLEGDSMQERSGPIDRIESPMQATLEKTQCNSDGGSEGGTAMKKSRELSDLIARYKQLKQKAFHTQFTVAVEDDVDLHPEGWTKSTGDTSVLGQVDKVNQQYPITRPEGETTCINSDEDSEDSEIQINIKWDRGLQKQLVNSNNTLESDARIVSHDKVSLVAANDQFDLHPALEPSLSSSNIAIPDMNQLAEWDSKTPIVALPPSTIHDEDAVKLDLSPFFATPRPKTHERRSLLVKQRSCESPQYNLISFLSDVESETSSASGDNPERCAFDHFTGTPCNGKKFITLELSPFEQAPRRLKRDMRSSLLRTHCENMSDQRHPCFRDDVTHALTSKAFERSGNGHMVKLTSTSAQQGAVNNRDDFSEGEQRSSVISPCGTEENATADHTITHGAIDRGSNRAFDIHADFLKTPITEKETFRNE